MTKLGLSTDQLPTHLFLCMYVLNGPYLIHALQSKTLMFSFFWPLKLTLFGQYGWWLTASECIIKIVVVMISTYKMCVQFSLLHREFSSVFDCSSKKDIYDGGQEKINEISWFLFGSNYSFCFMQRQNMYVCSLF